MLKEREKSHSRTITLLIERQGKKGIGYEPVFVNETASEDPAKFIIEERGRLRKRRKDLRTMPTGSGKKKARKDREKVVRKEHLVEKLLVLEGYRIQPIRLIKKGNKIQGLELGHFTDEKQKNLWMFCKIKDYLNKLAELTKDYPEGVELLSEHYDIRHRIKHGSSRETHEAEKELEQFISKSIDTPEKHDHLIVPLNKVIIEHFSSKF